MKKRLLGVMLSGILLVGCASQRQDTVDRPDPFETFNRAMFNFNYNLLDPYVVRPVAVAWRDYLPKPARNGMTNFFTNLSEPASMVNHFLVADPYTGMKHFTRFFLNTLLGMGGLIDVASVANPKQLGKGHELRFGSTLANYDVGYGGYLVLPGYGSFTLREDLGGRVDYLYPAFSWLTMWTSAGKWALEGIETRAQLLDSDGLIRNSADPYIAVREAYFQSKEFKADGGKVVTERNPNAAEIEQHLDEID